MLCGLGGSCSGVASELLDLLRLLVHNLGNVIDLFIDEALVGLVDKRSEKENAGGDERQTPQRNNLNQIVGEESTEEGLLLLTLSAMADTGKLTAPEAKRFSANTIR